MQITPVLLCGGSGTRLWPLSRKACPKQFTRLTGTETLFQATLARLSGQGWADPMIVTSAAYLDLVRDQAAQAALNCGTILVEPSARNTAPAILAAALELAQTDADALMLVAPSDHAIPDAAAFRATVLAGVEAAKAGQIITFGITPTRPETGYGWLELTETIKSGAPQPVALRRFVEKPPLAQAKEMLGAGRYLWNAGIFLATARTLIDAFASHAPSLFAPVRAALSGAMVEANSRYLAARPWSLADDISVDYAVMERAKNLSVVAFAAGWSDLGDWDAIWRETAVDGMATKGDVTTINCDRSLLRNDIPGVELVGIGLKDMVVVALDDTILVANRKDAQSVKTAVAQLKADRRMQAEQFAPRDAAWSQTHVDGTRFASRSVQIAPGSTRFVAADAPASRFTILSGQAIVTQAGQVSLGAEGSCFTTQAGQSMRIENPGRTPLVLVEVQIGGSSQPEFRHAPLHLPHFAIAAE